MKTRILILLTVGFAFSAQAQTSADNPKLKKALARFPEADANGDGILTLEEAREFREKAQGAGDRKDGRKTSGDRQVYKTVDGKALDLFIHNPPGHKMEAKTPAILLFHGGGFRSGSPLQFREQAAHFASRGMVAIPVTYRLTREPGVTVEHCVEDAKSAMRWVRANAAKLGIDPDRIAAGGGSAGGFLSVATELMEDLNAKTDPEGVSAKPNAMVLFNPAYGKPAEGKHADSNDPGDKGRLVRYVKGNHPPMINFFGSEDPFLPGAKEFQEAYRKAGCHCEIITYEGQGHSFFNKPEYTGKTLAAADKFLTELGWIGRKGGTE